MGGIVSRELNFSCPHQLGFPDLEDGDPTSGPHRALLSSPGIPGGNLLFSGVIFPLVC